MKDIIKTVHTEVTQTVDTNTGEIVDVSSKDIKIVVNSEDFCLVYAGLWNVILDNPMSKSDIELLSYIIKNYSDGTPFCITQYVKERVAQKTGKSKTTYDRSTAALKKYKLIIPVSGRTYILNPRYAFKGSSTNRKKALVELVEVCKDC